MLGAVSALLGWLVSLLLGPDAGYMVPITMIGHDMAYETFHFCCHVPDNAFVRHCPLINTIRRHHSAHHNMGIMMHINMNLTLPLADWALGTSDLNRGLLGHLFNGTNTTYQKPGLTQLMHKYRNAHIVEERVTLEGPQLDEDDMLALVSAGRVVST